MKQLQGIDIDIGRMMKAFVLTVFCGLLMIAPMGVHAQQAQSVSVSGDITPAGQLVAGTAIAVAVATAIGAIVLAIVNNKLATDKSQRDKESADSKAERDKAAAQTQNITDLVEAISTLGKGMSDQAAAAAKDRESASADRAKLIDIVETKDSAKQGRADGIGAINKHTEEVVEPVVKVIETAAKDIREAVVNVPTMEQFKAELASQLDPILEQLTEFGTRFAALVKQGDSSPHLELPSTPPPATPESAPP